MTKIVDIKEELDKILEEYWYLGYNDLYINLVDGYAIRVTKVENEIWFEVDKEPLLRGCYLYCSQNLKDVFDWCYDSLNLDILYY